MASSGRAALCAGLVHVVVAAAGCGRLDYDPSRDHLGLDAAMAPRDAGGLDGAGLDGAGLDGGSGDADRPDGAQLDAGVVDAATDAPGAHAFDGLQACAVSDDCPSGSCWGRWCVPSCSSGCADGFACASLPSSSFSFCLPRCDRAPSGCPAEAPCNGTVCEPLCHMGGSCPGSTICMVDTCSGD